jgi:hypothetical protein
MTTTKPAAHPIVTLTLPKSVPKRVRRSHSPTFASTMPSERKRKTSSPS